MDIQQFHNIELNPATAYITGLCFPLYKTISILHKTYIVGSINHNSNMINSSDLAEHYNSVLKLINMYFGVGKIKILSNQNDEQNISSKKGFSVLIEQNGKNDGECLKLLSEISTKILSSSIEIKKEFAKGCFDGRSSWDTTAHYLSLDVDRDYSRQDLIVKIIESLGIGININRRDINHPKNDQIRIKKDSVKKFISTIGLYSKCRTNLVENGINHI